MSNTNQILEEFDRWEKSLAHFEVRTRELLTEMIQASGISVHSIQARIKTRESLRRKCERPDKNYQAFLDVTDIAAFRIITYIDDDVDKVARQLADAFEVDPIRSIDKRKRKPSEFGYSALHSICRYSKNREELLENRNYRGLWWEVQVCSILQHAWNEIEHNIGYKSESKMPTDIERRLNRLVGTLELVDAEFKDIREKTENYRRAVDLRLEVQDADVSDIEIDSLSLRSFMSQDPAVAKAEKLMADQFNVPIASTFPDSKFGVALSGLQALKLRTLQELRQSLAENMDKLPAYVGAVANRFRSNGIEVTFDEIRKGMVITNLVIYLIGKQGPEGLEQLYRETGAYGPNSSRFAKLQAEAAQSVP